MSAKSIMQKATEIFILLFASIHLLYTGTTGYTHIFDAKKITFCVITSLYFLCAFFCLYIHITDEKKSIKALLKKHLSASHIFVLFYMFFTLISGIISQHFPYTIFGVSRFEGIYTICCYGLSFILVSLFPCRKKYVFTIFSVCVTLYSILCVIQLLGYNPLSLYPKGTNFYDAGVIYTTAFIGTTGNTNLSGAFICLALPLLTAALFKAQDKKRFLLIIPILFLSFTVLKMGVISTVLGILAGTTITIPFLLRLKKRGVILYFLLIAALLLTILSIIYFTNPTNGFISEISMILHGDISETFGSGRIRIWKNVLSEIPDAPIFGKGPDTMQKEKFPPFERFYPARNKVMKTGIDCAHNEFLNILYHQGILGLCAYLGFILCILNALWKNKQNNFVLSLGIALICYIVQSFFTFSMCLTAPYFWICSGLMIGICNQNKKEPTLN